MGASKHAVILILYYLSCQSEKHYIYPSINWIKDALKKYHGVSIERREIFYIMRYLQDQRFITVHPRWWKTETNLLRRRSSMISFTISGAGYLMRKLVKGAKEVYFRMLDWLKNKDHRWPLPTDVFPGDSDTDAQLSILRLKKLCKDIG
jgi:hypothetical protein